MEDIVQTKKSLLQESLLKIISLKHLIHRNKEILAARDLHDDEIIKIPFVVLVLPPPGLDSVFYEKLS